MDRYNVIAKCADGDIRIGYNGDYDLSLGKAMEVIYAHADMGVALMIVKVEK